MGFRVYGFRGFRVWGGGALLSVINEDTGHDSAVKGPQPLNPKL